MEGKRMLYNLRIGKTRFPGKTIAECCDIIAARSEKINAANRTMADVVLFDIRNMGGKYRRMAYFGNDGKVFISINRRETK
jgi:hypothetical protein